MNRLSIGILVALMATATGQSAVAKSKAAARAPAAEKKYCGTWVHGPNSYKENYSHFKPTTLLGTVQDGKFNLQVLARAEGGRWDEIQNIVHGECICLKGQRSGHFLKSVTGIFECNSGPERVPGEAAEAEDNT